MVTEPPNPHDAFFKQYLSHPDYAADFLRQHLPAEIIQLLDLSQLELQKDSFITEQLRSYFSDLIYRTKTNQQTPLEIALLFEHKSFPDEWVDFQILCYKTFIWQQEFDKIQAEKPAPGQKRVQRQRTLTPILVILVYHGKAEWKVSLRFARHFTGMEDPNSPLSQVLARYVPDFEPHLVNLSALSDEAIQGTVVTQLCVLVLKHIFEEGLGGHLDEILRLAAQIVPLPSGMEMVVALLRYIGTSGIKLSREEVAQKLLKMLPTKGEILMQTMASEWREEGLQEGRSLGWIAQQAMILQVLQHNFHPTIEETEWLKQQLAKITEDGTLSKLMNLALETKILPEFVLNLQGFLLEKAIRTSPATIG